LTASDSAATAPRPPGLASRARVTSKWAIKLNSKLIEANFNGLRTIHKSALQQCILPESAIRHTQADGQPGRTRAGLAAENEIYLSDEMYRLPGASDLLASMRRAAQTVRVKGIEREIAVHALRA
jgi:hypothetical protein